MSVLENRQLVPSQENFKNSELFGEAANDNQEAALGVPGSEHEGTNDRIEKVEKSLDIIADVVEKEKKQIDEIRAMLGIDDGVANDNQELTAMEITLDDKKNDLEKIKEGKSETDPVSMGGSLQEQYDGLVEKSKELREGFVEDYINKVIQNFYDEWSDYFSESVNEQKARDLIAQRTAGSIIKKAEHFIETGDDVESLGLSGVLRLVNHEDDTYISEFSITFDDGDSPQLSKEDIQKGSEKINSKIIEQIKASKKEDDKK